MKILNIIVETDGESPYVSFRTLEEFIDSGLYASNVTDESKITDAEIVEAPVVASDEVKPE